MGSEIEAVARKDVEPQTPNAIAYLRMATDRDADTASLDNQRAACQRLADEFGLSINIFAESGGSERSDGGAV